MKMAAESSSSKMYHPPTFHGEMKQSFKTYWPTRRWEAFAELKDFGEAIQYKPEDTDMPTRCDAFSTTDTALKARQLAATMKRN